MLALTRMTRFAAAGRSGLAASARPLMAAAPPAAGASAAPAVSNTKFEMPARFANEISYGPGTLGGVDTPEAAALETPTQTALRWMDWRGFLSQSFSRRAWIMEWDPIQRASMFTCTEYERWYFVGYVWAMLAMFPIMFWYWFGEYTHMCSKPPVPQAQLTPCTNWFKVPMDYFPMNDVVTVEKCQKCRMLEMECRKVCFDELRDMGYNIWGCDLPRTQTYGFH